MRGTDHYHGDGSDFSDDNDESNHKDSRVSRSVPNNDKDNSDKRTKFPSGNTFRLRVDEDRSATKIASNHTDVTIDCGDGTYDVPITQIDLDFSELYDAIIKRTGKYSFARDINSGDEQIKSLDSGKLWEIQSSLEEASVRTQHLSEQARGLIKNKIVFEVPIIGTVRVTKDKQKTIVANTTFDDKGDETENGSTVKRIGDSITYRFADVPPGHVNVAFDIIASDSGTYEYKTAKIPMIRVYDRVKNKLIEPADGTYGAAWRYNTSYWKPRDSEKKNSFVVIDLGSDMNVSYISTMGRPYKLTTVPYASAITTFGFGARDPIFAGPLYGGIPSSVANDSMDMEYVKRFTLHGRTSKGKWFVIGTYAANIDRITEKLIDLTHDIPDNLKLRYLKVVPIDYVGSKSMRFMVYAPIKSVNEDSSGIACRVVGNVNDVTTDMRIKYFITPRNEETTYTRDWNSRSKCRYGHLYRVDSGPPRRDIRAKCDAVMKAYNTKNLDDFACSDMICMDDGYLA